MNVTSFDPSTVSGYGTSGQETAREMASRLKAHSLSITYNTNYENFTIHNSSEIDKETIAKIFSEAVYIGWEPQVLDETDRLGNLLVELRAVESGSIKSEPDLRNDLEVVRIATAVKSGSIKSEPDLRNDLEVVRIATAGVRDTLSRADTTTN